MARALLLALAYAVTATATRYADYPGRKMPQYGPVEDYDAIVEPDRHHSSEDYHGHSPDAPSSLDYKFDEEQHNPKVSEKVVSDTDGWPKRSRKHKDLMMSEDEGNIDTIKYNADDEEVPRSRASHRHKKHRPRLRTDDEPPPRRVIKYNKDKKASSHSNRKVYSEIDRDNFPDDKSKEFEDIIRETTMRVRRRKPRDRDMKGYETDMNRVDEIMELERRLKSDDERVYQPESRRLRPIQRPNKRPDQRPDQQPDHREEYRPEMDDDDEVKPTKPRLKEYDEYGDYYDMRRLNSIKEKLPSLLLRQTTVSSPTSMKTTVATDWQPSMPFITNRRRLTVAPVFPPVSRSFPDPIELEDLPYDDETAIKTSSSKRDDKSSSVSSPTHTTTHTTLTMTTTPKSTTELTTKTTTTTTTVASESTIKELSIAEKSRLSILKKALRKESGNVETTKKPPVLLQVRQKMQTVVMVEPPSTRSPWLRMREMGADSPEHLERAKQLMRQKLVAEAKDIHELTDNWDEMVCDYIDTALLDNGAPIHYVSVVMLVLLILMSYIF